MADFKGDKMIPIAIHVHLHVCMGANYIIQMINKINIFYYCLNSQWPIEGN